MIQYVILCALAAPALKAPQECQPGLSVAPAASFGQSLSIRGNTLAISEPGFQAFPDAGDRGRVSIFGRDSESGPWELEALLTLPPTAPNLGFGASISTDGDRIAIGAKPKLSASMTNGGVFIYTKVFNDWVFTDLVQPAASGIDGFGDDVALNGGRLFVLSSGAFGQVNDAPAVYDFKLTPSGWTEQSSFTGSSLGIPTIGPDICASGELLSIRHYPSNPFGGAADTSVFRILPGSTLLLGVVTGPDGVTAHLQTCIDGSSVFCNYGGPGPQPTTNVLKWDALNLNAPPETFTITHQDTSARVSLDTHDGRLAVRTIDGSIDSVQILDWVGALQIVASGEVCPSLEGASTKLAPIAVDGDGAVAGAPTTLSGLAVPLVATTPGQLVPAKRLSPFASVSASLGGTVEFNTQFGPSEAGSLSWILGSLTGSAPGVPTAAGVIPLAPDGYTLSILQSPITGPIPGSLGLLDPSGGRVIELTVPPNVIQTMPGVTAFHAAVTLDLLTFDVRSISNSVELLIDS